MCTNYCLNLCEYQLIVKRNVYICIFSLISLFFDFFQHFVWLSCPGKTHYKVLRVS